MFILRAGHGPMRVVLLHRALVQCHFFRAKKTTPSKKILLPILLNTQCILVVQEQDRSRCLQYFGFILPLHKNKIDLGAFALDDMAVIHSGIDLFTTKSVI